MRNGPVIVVMGVSGSGKTTVAATLARRLGWPWQEGDDLHPDTNVAKMASGRALTDHDRRGWLAAIAEWIDRHSKDQRPGIVTCSALKRRYRDQLRRPGVVFVHLNVTGQEVRRRMVCRRGHFMPESLLATQLATLEPPEPDENAIVVNGEDDPDAIAQEIIDRLLRPVDATAAQGV